MAITTILSSPRANTPLCELPELLSRLLSFKDWAQAPLSYLLKTNAEDRWLPKERGRRAGLWPPQSRLGVLRDNKFAKAMASRQAGD